MWPFKKNPLLDAIKLGDSQSVEKLIREGEDVNRKSGLSQKTPLHVAAEKGGPEIVSLLLSAGALPNETDSQGKTPLHYALKNESQQKSGLKKTMLLLDAHADPLVMDNGEDAPFATALDMHDDSLVSAMLKNVDPKNVNRKGWTPLHTACEKGNERAFLALIQKGADVNAKTGEGLCPIHLASYHGHAGIVKKLIDSRVDVNVKGADDMTPLHTAANGGTKEVVKLLLEKGADMNRKNANGTTPVEVIDARDHYEKLVLFRDAGLDIGGYNPSGYTLLHDAAIADNPELIKAFVKAGVNVDSWSKKELSKVKATPLHLACALNKRNAAHALIECGADVNAIYEDEAGMRATPMKLARSNQHMILTAEIENAGGKWFED